MRRIAIAAIIIFLLGCALFVGWLFYERYWRWLDCFNELGRWFDPESETVATDSNFMYGLASALALVLAPLAAVSWPRKRPSSAHDIPRPYLEPAA
jgi:hypothetical protein